MNAQREKRARLLMFDHLT